MCPVIHIGSIRLYSYVLLTAVSFFVGISWSIIRAPRHGVSPIFTSRLSWILVVTGLIGTRLGYFLFERPIREFDLVAMFRVWEPGMVFYGGFGLAVLSAILFCRMKSVSFFSVADVAAPPIALAHAFGRVGCLLAGCCYGKPSHLPWAIRFAKNRWSPAPPAIALHPTQIYEIIGLCFIVSILLLVERRQRFSGQIFALYLALYACLRMAVEHFRGDDDRGFVSFGRAYPNSWLSTSTAIGLAMIAVAAAIVVIRGRVSPKRTP